MMKQWEVIHGDCLDVMADIPTDAVIVTDPPYGIGVTRMTLGNRKGLTVDRGGHWDDSAPSLEWMVALGRRAVVWGGNHFTLPVSTAWLVWDKGTGDNDFADAELAWTNGTGTIRMFRRGWVGANAKERGDEDRYHPTQKPVELMRWCIARLKLEPGTLVVDPYCGSGTTGVAAMMEGMRFLGIEREARYVETARRRIAAAAAQTSLDLGEAA